MRAEEDADRAGKRLGRYGKTDNGVVTVTTLWADERAYYLVDAVPYTPARHFRKGEGDPGFPHRGGGWWPPADPATLPGKAI